MKTLNLDFVQKHFPALNREWTYMDNAGGTQAVRQVGERINDYLFNSNVQLGASYEVSQEAGDRLIKAQSKMAEFVNAKSFNEIILGSSTTQLLHNLSKSLVQLFKPGDEVIVTNSDHEANIGPWLNMKKDGIILKVWEINRDTLHLELNDLKQLMTNKTKLVAFTHTSNILGTINPVKEIVSFVHDKGALTCIDGVAYAPHRLVDVKDIDADFYVFSMYKVYGPHYSLLYGKQNILSELPGINHYFIGNEEIPYKLQPGNINYELTYGLLGVIDYFREVHSYHFSQKPTNTRNQLKEVFDLFANHEEVIVKPLIDFLKSKKNVRIIGESSADQNKRVPTISFVVENVDSSSIPLQVDPNKIGIRYGDFYARRLINSLDLQKQNGVVRISLVHYNTMEEVLKLIDILDQIL